MNTEYALIKLLLDNPRDIIQLNRNGFRPNWFKNAQYKKVYNRILDSQIRLNSIPTKDELDELGFEEINEEVSYSLEKCVENIINNYNREYGKKISKQFGEALINKSPIEAKEMMADAIRKFADLGKAEKNKDINDLTEEVLAQYRRVKEHKGEITGVPTGFELLDSMTMGFQPTWLVTIMGRNASFKTWILIQWALHAWKLGYNIGFFSCEMGATEVANRIHALASNIQPTKVRHGNLEPDEEERFENHLMSCANKPFGKLIINDNPSSMLEIESIIEEQQEGEHPFDIIFVDSAYRMKSEGDSEVVKQGNIARNAKNLAKKFNIPVVCSIQANREFAKANSTEKTKDKTVSGGFFGYGTDAWNQDSDMIFLINRPENFAPFNYSEFIMDKYRHGSVENFILEINLNLPKIRQIDANEARSKVAGAPTQTTQDGEAILNSAQELTKDFILFNNK
jgi:replicative DNA helicase